MITDSTNSQRQNASRGELYQGSERDVLASRLAYLTVGLPTVGTVGAIVYAVYNGFRVSDVVLFAVMYLITGLGVEGGLHRYFTHRSFDASEPVKVFLAVAGSMAAQGPVVFWVANHRLHHAFAETDRDPHSRNLKAQVSEGAKKACGTAMLVGCSTSRGTIGAGTPVIGCRIVG